MYRPVWHFACLPVCICWLGYLWSIQAPLERCMRPICTASLEILWDGVFVSLCVFMHYVLCIYAVYLA